VHKRRAVLNVVVVVRGVGCVVLVRSAKVFLILSNKLRMCCGMTLSVTLVFPFNCSFLFAVALVSTIACQSWLSGLVLLDVGNGWEVRNVGGWFAAMIIILPLLATKSRRASSCLLPTAPKLARSVEGIILSSCLTSVLSSQPRIYLSPRPAMFSPSRKGIVPIFQRARMLPPLICH